MFQRQWPLGRRSLLIRLSILISYNSEEQNQLFGNTQEDQENTEDDKDAVVHRLTDRRGNKFNNNNNFNNSDYKNQFFSRFSNTNRSNNMDNRRKRINATCPACGCFGHDANKNGCDLTAQVLMILRYIKKEPNRIKTIINKYQDHQEGRKQYLQNKSRFSDRFRKNAVARNFKYGPQVWALFDIVGDTLDDIMDEENGIIHQLDEDDDASGIVDLIHELEDTSTDNDTYHDSQQSDQK